MDFVHNPYRCGPLRVGRYASFPFFIFLSAASTSHAIIGGTSLGSVCIVTAWSLSYNSE